MDDFACTATDRTARQRGQPVPRSLAAVRWAAIAVLLSLIALSLVSLL